MSTKIITFRHSLEGVLTNATTVKLSDPTGTYGLRRVSDSSIVVADGTSFTNSATGIYTYEATGLSEGVEYDYWIEWVYQGATNRTNRTFTTSSASGGVSLPGYARSLLRQAAEFAAGAAGGSLPKGVSLSLILRAAVERLCGAHPWAWLNVSTTLDLTADTAYVDLPSDFADLGAVQGTEDNRYTFRPTAIGELLRMRAQLPLTLAAGTGMLWMYAVDTVSQTGVTAVPRYRLELYPTPTATEADAIALHYRKQVAPPAADSDVVDVPPAAFHALLEVVRAEASKATLDGSKPRQAVYEANEAAAERAITRLKGRDGGEQVNLGCLTGGVGDEDAGADYLYPTTISPA